MVETTYWGPGTWNLLYSIAHECDIDNLCRDDFIEFLNILAKLLPCEECRGKFGDYLSNHPIGPEEKLKIWVNDLHNDVRRRLGKQVISINTINKKLDPPIVPKKIVRRARNINIQSIGGGRSLHSTIATPVISKPTPEVKAVPKPPIQKSVNIVHTVSPVIPVKPAAPKTAITSKDVGVGMGKAPARKGCGCGGKR